MDAFVTQIKNVLDTEFNIDAFDDLQMDIYSEINSLLSHLQTTKSTNNDYLNGRKNRVIKLINDLNGESCNTNVSRAREIKNQVDSLSAEIMSNHNTEQPTGVETTTMTDIEIYKPRFLEERKKQQGEGKIAGDPIMLGWYKHRIDESEYLFVLKDVDEAYHRDWQKNIKWGAPWEWPKCKISTCQTNALYRIQYTQYCEQHAKQEILKRNMTFEHGFYEGKQ